MSIGAIVPTSTRRWLFLSDVCASSSDCWATSQPGDRADQVEVGVADRPRRSASASAAAAGRRSAAASALSSSVLARAVDREVAQQRLRERRRRFESSCGLKRLDASLGRQLRGVPARAVAAAAPREQLLEPAFVRKLSLVRVVLVAGQEVARRRRAAARRRLRKQARREHGAGLGDAVGLDLRRQLLGLNRRGCSRAPS